MGESIPVSEGLWLTDSPPGSGVFQDNLISFGMGLASQKVVLRISAKGSLASVIFRFHDTLGSDGNTLKKSALRVGSLSLLYLEEPETGPEDA
ncbi:hypothetical protein EYF80_040103 [Liparis tanakae]|uniref:Uncharacterized protein n=1 Tax=Liparis tanakae TaxID=230148 RepID=A0A4Z2G834_9TELE|nr:hypothetical protein EYF80_040103 [Liparis tanakae]